MGGAGARGVHADVVEEPDLDDGADVHAGAEEEDIAERVVAHLAAQDVPGRGEHDHQPEHRDLVAVSRGTANGATMPAARMSQIGQRLAGDKIHCTACRTRRYCNCRYGQHAQQQQHDQRLLEFGAEQEAAELLEHAHAEAGGDDGRQIADAGRGHDHEQADRIGGAEERLHVPDQRDQRAGRAADRRVEAEGERVDLLGIDAEHAGGARILRGGADRLPHAAVLHEHDDRQRQHDGQAETEEAGGPEW